MDPLSLSASIVAVLQLTGKVIQYLNCVKGAPKDRQRLLSELCNVNCILYILQNQADQAENGEQWSLTLHALSSPGGLLSQFEASVESLTFKLSPVEGWAKVGKALRWPFEKDEIHTILEEIERQKSGFILAQQNDHIALSKAIVRGISATDYKTDRLCENFGNAQLDVAHYYRLRAWLRAPDPSLNYNKALGDRHAETGAWLVSSTIFEVWRTRRNSFLWLYGIPGCGVYIFEWHCTQSSRNVLYVCCRQKAGFLALFLHFRQFSIHNVPTMTNVEF